ncbi:MAG TPA: translation initiation factor IF-2 subunit gamma, partial [Candidatus Binatus sp.]|nr:translation initiation factor IF-2 subunit gamma [Candidatus Binatus sp.]
KIDVVDRQRALENRREIESFVKGTFAEGAPIIPVSAQRGLNMDALIEAIQEKMPTPKRDQIVPPRLSVLRSFDINKPGTESDDLRGGVVGGSVLQGTFKKGDEIEIKPGIRVEGAGKTTKYETLIAEVESLQAGGGEVRQIHPGGLVALGTNLDPSVTKSDGLVGNVVGKAGSLPPTLEKPTMDVKLFELAIGTEQLVPVQKVKTNEPLVLNVGTAVTSGIVSSAREDIVEVTLKKPICADPGSKAALSRRIGESWRLIGFGTIR